MTKKKIQMSRMWKYFVEATAEIIEEEGIDQVTIRKVADRAGYNSATIYNYFTEISHLIFFASMKYLKPYTEEVTKNMERSTNPLEKYIFAWETFCQHSFRQPQIFHAIFIMDLGDQPGKLIHDYYEKYPADLINIPEDLKPILFERNISKRGKTILGLAVKEGLLLEEQIDDINEMSNLIWQGMLTNVINNRTSYDAEEASRTVLKFIHQIVENAKADLGSKITLNRPVE